MFLLMHLCVSHTHTHMQLCVIALLCAKTPEVYDYTPGSRRRAGKGKGGRGGGGGTRARKVVQAALEQLPKWVTDNATTTATTTTSRKEHRQQGRNNELLLRYST